MVLCMEVSWIQGQAVSMPVRMWGRMRFWQAACRGIAAEAKKESGKRKAAKARSGRIR